MKKKENKNKFNEGISYNFEESLKNHKPRTEEENELRKSIYEAFGMIDPEEVDLDDLSQEEMYDDIENMQNFMDSLAEYIKSNLPNNVSYYINPVRYKECMDSIEKISAKIYALFKATGYMPGNDSTNFKVEWGEGLFGEIEDTLVFTIKFNQLCMDEKALKELCEMLPENVDISLYLFNLEEDEIKLIIEYKNVRQAIETDSL